MRQLISRANTTRSSIYLESEESFSTLQPELLEESAINGAIATEETSLLSLESAHIQLINLESIVEDLEGAGASEETATATLAPLVESVIATVDSEVAEETTVALESDGPKGYWARVKETIAKIWQAIKDALGRLMEFIKSLFTNSKNMRGKVEAYAKNLGTALNKVGNLKSSDIKVEGRWVINSEVTAVRDIVNSTAKIVDFGAFADGLSTGILKNASDVVGIYTEALVKPAEKMDASRIDKLESAEKRVNFESPAAIAEHYKDSQFKEFVGLTLKEGKYVPSTIPSSQTTIDSGSKDDCERILDEVNRKLSAEAKGNVGARLDSALKAFQAKVDSVARSTDKFGDLDKELIKRVSALPSKANAVFTVVRQWFDGHDLKATHNALSFVDASIKAGKTTKA